MHHFFVTPDQITGEAVRITGQDVNHIRNVLRMREGEQVGIRDGVSGSYLCCLEEIGPDAVTARILQTEDEGRELPARLYLFQGLPKSDKMELIIQKAVELGVTQIIPVATRRAVVKLEPKKEEAKLRRWNLISESAAKQSGRLLIPEVTGVMSLKEALSYADGFHKNLIPYELAKGMGETKSYLKEILPGMQVGIFIGPEGGFDTEEIEEAVSHGVKPITLGRRILRTETAGLTALSVLMFQLEQD